MRRRIGIWLVVLLAAVAAFAQKDERTGATRLLRYPDIYKDTIVFVYGGDLWLADAAGGAARRLTSDPGEELFPKFSPDGRQIAFTGQYGGNRQVYVIGVDGGAPRQLTFHNDVGTLPPRGGVDNQVLGWTPDGKQVLFNAHRTPWSDRISRPHLVPVDGGMEVPLKIPEGGSGTLSPDGTKLVYTPIMREFRTWKHYHGGRAQDLWIYDLKKDTAERLTDYDGTDNQPVWIGNTIYFTSDRDWTLNLYALDLGSRQPRQVTHHASYDVLWPSGDDRRIVYENGGQIWLFDPATAETHAVPIQVVGDLPHTLPSLKNVTADIQSLAISPTGKRALFGAHGDVFTVPAAKGEVRDLTRTPGVREMSPAWSPDGRSIAYLSDRSGEYEIYLRQSDGSGDERRLTSGGNVWLFPPLWSPDSKKLAFGDKKQRLRWVDVASGKVVDADRSASNDIDDYRWSPDSRWLTYTKVGPTHLSAIWVYSLDQGKAFQLTSGAVNDGEPHFDPKGRYLYFLSNRDFNLTFSGFEFDYLYTNPTRVYVGLLAKDGPALFLPQSDEEPFKDESAAKPDAKPSGKSGAKPKKPPQASDTVQTAKSGKPDKDGDAAKTDAAPAKVGPVRIDVDGFERRVRAIPGAAADYRDLAASGDSVFYRVGEGAKVSLKVYNLEQRKEDTVLDGVQAYELSADGKKILYRQGDSYAIVDAAAGQKAGDGKLALDKLEAPIDPRAEWQEMYVDAWRIVRDFFYEPGMNGVDWPAMRDKYAALLPWASTRADLDFLLGELAGELTVGHAYVEPNDENSPVKRVDGGLLGAEIEADASGYFRIAKIFPGENWQADFRSPLTEPGVHVDAGDFILAVDGQTTRGVDNFYRLLQGKADHAVTLLVNHRPSADGARTETVRPVKSEQNLRYLDWVQATREKVDRLSGGRIGYIHLPNTALEGNRELFKGFYAQSTKDALILDDRWNGGGFVPDRMIALLSRPLLSYWVRRGIEPTATPTFFNTGPKVTLINGQAGSGGDAFPYYFRKTGLGPLIGTRTWGGLIGISNSPPLLDGGTLTAPSFRFLTPDGQWTVEGIGVAPDIEVVDRPDEMAKGRDPSLEKAIDYLLKELAAHPPAKLVVPPPPRTGAKP